MNKSLLYMLLLLLIVFGLDRVTNLVMEEIYSQTLSGQSGGKINHFVSVKEDINFLTVGDSRSAHHIVPSELGENVFNLSHNGLSLVFHVGLANQLIVNEYIQIDTLLLHVDYQEAFADFDNYADDILYLKYYYKRNEWIKKMVDSTFMYEFVKHFFNSYKWNGKLLTTLNNWRKTKNGDIPYNGYVPTLYSPDDSLKVFLTRKQPIYNLDSSEREVEDSYFHLLSELKNICDNNDIELICFTSPSYEVVNDYRKFIYKSFIDSMGIPFIDFSTEAIYELSDIKYWKDFTHLNHDGALLFTAYLRKELDELEGF